jgi:hypothetical protein
MDRRNKAQVATVNRLLRRYGGEYRDDSGLRAKKGLIAIETGATVATSVRRLMAADGARYLAVTNREVIPDALEAVNGYPIGVMDPQGRVIKTARRAAADRQH